MPAFAAPALRLDAPGTSFDVLPWMAGGLGLDTRTDHTLWKDRALTRGCRSAGWAPTGGGSCRTYDTGEHRPAYVHHPEALARARSETDASVAAWSNTPRMV